MRRRNKIPTKFVPSDAHQARLMFLGMIVTDAILICKKERRAGELEIASCRAFLESEKCERWLDFLGVNPDCIEKRIG